MLKIGSYTTSNQNSNFEFTIQSEIKSRQKWYYGDARLTKASSKGKIFKVITAFLRAHLAFYHLISMLVKCVKKKGGDLMNRLGGFLLNKLYLFREGLNQTVRL